MRRRIHLTLHDAEIAQLNLVMAALPGRSAEAILLAALAEMARQVPLVIEHQRKLLREQNDEAARLEAGNAAAGADGVSNNSDPEAAAYDQGGVLELPRAGDSSDVGNNPSQE